MDQPTDDLIKLSTGNFTVEELEAIFSALPAEISFVDKNDIVRFFSNKPDRLFLRGKGALGRDLRLCHPPRFQAVMQQIIGDFKSGKEDKALFWRSSHKDKFISIEYIALRNKNKEYLGTLEVVQDISEIRTLEGDRRELVYTKKE
ncbi:MAG: PAS domain-containing protein [Bacteroidales bacterium]